MENVDQYRRGYSKNALILHDISSGVKGEYVLVFKKKKNVIIRLRRMCSNNLRANEILCSTTVLLFTSLFSTCLSPLFMVI